MDRHFARPLFERVATGPIITRLGDEFSAGGVCDVAAVPPMFQPQELHARGEEAAFLRSFDDDLRFVFITSQARVIEHGAGTAVDAAGSSGIKLTAHPSSHRKCERCWHYRADVGCDAAHADICGRCVSNLYGSGEVRTHA